MRLQHKVRKDRERRELKRLSTCRKRNQSFQKSSDFWNPENRKIFDGDAASNSE